jgi:hypothetical protein
MLAAVSPLFLLSQHLPWGSISFCVVGSILARGWSPAQKNINNKVVRLITSSVDRERRKCHRGTSNDPPLNRTSEQWLEHFILTQLSFKLILSPKLVQVDCYSHKKKVFNKIRCMSTSPQNMTVIVCRTVLRHVVQQYVRQCVSWGILVRRAFKNNLPRKILLTGQSHYIIWCQKCVTG